MWGVCTPAFGAIEEDLKRSAFAFIVANVIVARRLLIAVTVSVFVVIVFSVVILWIVCDHFRFHYLT